MTTTRQEHEADIAAGVAKRCRALRLMAGRFTVEADSAPTDEDRTLALEGARILGSTAKLARACLDHGVPSGFVADFLDAHQQYVVGTATTT